MRSSDLGRALGVTGALLAACAYAPRAEAQQAAQGFAVERFYPSAPGGGWFVMDELSMHGGLGGVMAVTSGYARAPLRIGDGPRPLVVVSDQASVGFGFAATYERLRLYLNLDAPLVINGQSGAVGGSTFTPPSVNLGSHPDTISDVRIGFDARLVGDAGSPFRLGVGAQLFVPNGSRDDYDTDGTFRAMFRLLFAGDVGLFTYAGQLGVHVRPLDAAATPGGPQGSELLFGVAAGVRLPVAPGSRTRVVVGPEIYGETAFRSFLGTDATGVEGLLTLRLEGSGEGPQLRAKFGAGVGLNPAFGAPEWRLVFGLELFDQSALRR